MDKHILKNIKNIDIFTKIIFKKLLNDCRYGLIKKGSIRDMKYLCHDVFMIRVPSLPLKVFSDFDKMNVDISDYISKNEYIKGGN